MIMPGCAPLTYLASLVFTSGDSWPKTLRNGKAKSSCFIFAIPWPASASNTFVANAPAFSRFAILCFLFHVYCFLFIVVLFPMNTLKISVGKGFPSPRYAHGQALSESWAQPSTFVSVDTLDPSQGSAYSAALLSSLRPKDTVNSFFIISPRSVFTKPVKRLLFVCLSNSGAIICFNFN